MATLLKAYLTKTTHPIKMFRMLLDSLEDDILKGASYADLLFHEKGVMDTRIKPYGKRSKKEVLGSRLLSGNVKQAFEKLEEIYGSKTKEGSPQDKVKDILLVEPFHLPENYQKKITEPDDPRKPDGKQITYEETREVESGYEEPFRLQSLINFRNALEEIDLQGFGKRRKEEGLLSEDESNTIVLVKRIIEGIEKLIEVENIRLQGVSVKRGKSGDTRATEIVNITEEYKKGLQRLREFKKLLQSAEKYDAEGTLIYNKKIEKEVDKLIGDSSTWKRMTKLSKPENVPIKQKDGSYKVGDKTLKPKTPKEKGELLGKYKLFKELTDDITFTNIKGEEVNMPLYDAIKYVYRQKYKVVLVEDASQLENKLRIALDKYRSKDLKIKKDIIVIPFAFNGLGDTDIDYMVNLVEYILIQNGVSIVDSTDMSRIKKVSANVLEVPILLKDKTGKRLPEFKASQLEKEIHKFSSEPELSALKDIKVTQYGEPKRMEPKTMSQRLARRKRMGQKDKEVTIGQETNLEGALSDWAERGSL